MSRMIGDLNYTDGGRTGYVHTNEYVGVAQTGHEFNSPSGGFSGIFLGSIYFEAHDNFSGIAQSFIGLMTSGNMILEARAGVGAGQVTVSGENINVNAAIDITFQTQSRDVTLLANRDAAITSIARNVTITTNSVNNTGNVVLSSSNTIQNLATKQIFNRTPTRYEVYAYSQALVSGQIYATLTSRGKAVVSGVDQGVLIVAGCDEKGLSTPNDLIMLASGNLIEISGPGDMTRTAWQGNIIDTAALDYDLQANNVNISGVTLIRMETKTGDITRLADAGSITDQAQQNINIQTSPSSTGTISVISQKDLLLKSTAGTITIASTGASATSLINQYSQNKMDLRTVSSSADIGLTAGQNILLKPNAGSIICTPRTAGTQTTDGKTIFSNVIANNHAPINISGVNTVNSFMTGAAAGDFAFQNPGNESGPGAGRFWYNSGSGMAPISMGSGYFLAYDDESSTGGVGVSIGVAATIIGFNQVVVRDRQYQFDPTGATTSGTVIVTNDGLYKITYAAGFQYVASSVTTAGVVQCQLYINGNAYTPSSSYAGNTQTGNTLRGSSASTLAFLSAGDQVTLRATRVTGGATRTNNGDVWIMFERLR